jgi:hypothetical protein
VERVEVVPAAAGSGTWGRFYKFLKVIRKKLAKNGGFIYKYSNLCAKNHHNNFSEKRQFFTP